MTKQFLVLHRLVGFSNRFPWAACAAVLITLIALPSWGATLVPLATWSSNGDGWLAPGEDGYPYLGGANTNTERGLAYGNNHLYLSSRVVSPSIRILDPNTGAEIGSLDMTGISGGTFAIDGLAVGGDGAIYVTNLTTQSTTSPLMIYRWANEAATPTLVYSGDGGLAGSRIGDSFAGIGSGSSTRLVAGFGSQTAVAGNNGYTIIDPTAGTATAVAFSGTPPNAGDFRLGITFKDSTHVIGAGQTTSVYSFTSFAGATGTLISTTTIPDPAGATADKLVAYSVVGGVPMLAVQSAGDSHVQVYNVSDPTAPVYLVSHNNTTAPATNGNQTGQLAWGATTVNGDGSVSQILYGLSTNQGIQAYTFTLESPPVPGDYDGDHVVNAGDYVLWRKTLGNSVTPLGSGADGSGDGTVGPEDYTFWRSRFGNPNPGSGASLGSALVPEPGTFVLAVVAMVGGILQRRRRLNIC